jgi:hypothetical protein
MHQSSEEQLFYAQDAYSSAILLSSLLLMSQIFALVVLGGRPLGVATRFALAGIAAVALGYLLSTRRHPRERSAWAVCALLTAVYLVELPWVAVSWGHLGRPWESFIGPQIAIVCMGLTVPGSFWLGTAAVLAYLLQALGIYLYFVVIGTPRNALPVTEPAMMFVFAATGVVVVVARGRRRALALRYIHAQAEAATLTRLSSLIRELVDELGTLEALSTGLARIAAANPRPIERGRAAIARLLALRDQLVTLIAQPAVREPTKVPNEQPAPMRQTRARSRFRLRIAEPTVVPDRSVDNEAGPALSDAERQFYARDTHEAARVTAIGMVVAMIASIVAAGHRSALLKLLYGGCAAVAVICLAILRRTQARPSERRGLVLYLATVVPPLCVFAYSQQQWAYGTEAFEPLIATKLIMVVLALAAPRHLWLSLTLVVLVAAEGFVFFYAYHFDAMQNRIPMSEPWSFLVYLLIAGALLVLREQRRVASIRILRADRERAALTRQAAVVLALLDQLGTPLQILALSTAMVFQQQPDHPERKGLELALERIASLRRRLPKITPQTYDSLGVSGVSVDAESELRPH